MAFGVSTKSAAITKEMLRHETHNSRMLTATDAPETGGVPWPTSVAIHSRPHASQATAKDKSPKTEAADTTAAAGERTLMRAVNRWTSVPLKRSNPRIPAATVVVVHMPTMPLRIHATHASPPHA